MRQYNSVNEKLSKSQLYKVKSATANVTGVILTLSLNIIGNLIEETIFPYRSLLTNRKLQKLHRVI